MNLKVVLVLGAMLCLAASQEVRGRDKRTIGALFGHFSGFFGSKSAPPPTTTTPKPQPVFSLNSLFQGLDFFKQIPQLSQPPKFQQQQQPQPAPPPPASPPAQLPIPVDPPMAPSQPPSPGPSKIPLPLGPVGPEQPPAAPQPDPSQTPQPEPPMPPSPVPEQPESTPESAAQPSPSPPAVDVTINLSSTAESLPPTTAGNAQPKNDGSAEGSFETPLDSFEQTKAFSFGQDFGGFPQKSFAYQNFPQSNFQYSIPDRFETYEFQPVSLPQNFHQQFVNFAPSAHYVPAKVSHNALPTTYNHFGPSMAKSSVKMPHAAHEHITYHDNSGEFNGGYHAHY